MLLLFGAVVLQLRHIPLMLIQKEGLHMVNSPLLAAEVFHILIDELRFSEVVVAAIRFKLLNKFLILSRSFFISLC